MTPSKGMLGRMRENVGSVRLRSGRRLQDCAYSQKMQEKMIAQRAHLFRFPVPVLLDIFLTVSASRLGTVLGISLRERRLTV